MAKAWRSLMEALGYDPEDPHLKESPERVARFMVGWHTNVGAKLPKMTTFPVPKNYDGLIQVDGFPFHSICAHHGLPFFGTATVGYIPSKRLVGLSKLVRVVQHFSHRFQTQEQIAAQVADFLMEALEPHGVGVVLRGEHMCMSMRGVAVPGTVTTTSSMRGVFLEDLAARSEFMSLIKR